MGPARVRSSKGAWSRTASAVSGHESVIQTYLGVGRGVGRVNERVLVKYGTRNMVSYVYGILLPICSWAINFHPDQSQQSITRT